jgi:hypothetical protein
MDVLMRKAAEVRIDTNWTISEQLKKTWILVMIYAIFSRPFVNREKMVRDLQRKSSSGRLLINSEGTKSLTINTRNE